MSLHNTYFYESVGEKKNFAPLLNVIDASEMKEDDKNYQKVIYLMYEEPEEKLLDFLYKPV